MPKFTLRVTRVIEQIATLKVTAASIDSARSLVARKLRSMDWQISETIDDPGIEEILDDNGNVLWTSDA